MTKRSVEKLLKAGYIFLRKGEWVDKNFKKIYKIKEMDSFRDWHTFENFDTQTARDKKLRELDETQFFLVDE